MSEADPTARAGLRAHLPGLAVTALATLAAAYVSDHYGAPLTLMALLFGLALNFLGSDARLAPGLAFASRTLLRLGIVLVAARVTLAEIAHLGPIALLALAVIVAATLLSGLAAARAIGHSPAFGVLGGGAVAICGASAAMALASLLGERRASQTQLTLVLVGVAAASAIAMTLYPLIAHALGFTEAQAGFMLGASIHDVAQAVGAGYAVSPSAGDTATIVKLARVAMLAPAMLVVSAFIPREPGARILGFALPWFVAGFFGVAAVNTLGWIPAAAAKASADASAALLACAVTATGVRSNLQALTGEGLKPLVVIVVATLVALGLATAAAAWLIV
ncbi:MAG: putative sulfate exporter family transporter [Pseudomonadota bacterium]